MSLDRAANRFQHRQAASRAVINHGLEQQRHTRKLAQRLGAERNHLDGLPSAAEMRQAAMHRQQLKAFAQGSQHEPPVPRSPRIEL
jgi:hypothetical protein